jgi:glycosyltransferase involved in cell wall biosynthesis
MQNNKKVIGIIMTYNCAHLLEDAFKALPQGVFDQLIISDDGSKDNIREVAEKIGVPLFVHEHSGYGGNLRNGLKQAIAMGGDTMIEIHGDGQFDSSVAPLAVEKVYQDDLDFLIGSRFTKGAKPLKDGMPLPRFLANIGLSFIERCVLRIPWSEFHAGFRVYRKRFAEKVLAQEPTTVFANDYLFSFQIIALAGWMKARCGEIPVRANYHKAHTSVGYWKASINSFQEMWVLLLYILAKLGVKNTLFK